MLHQNWFMDERFEMFEEYAERQSFYDAETKNIYIVSEEDVAEGTTTILEITPESLSYQAEIAIYKAWKEIKEGLRTIKMTAGMTQEFEIIKTTAPDHVIKAQLMYISACEEEGKEVPENPYDMIVEFGYYVTVVGSQDSLSEEDLETITINAEFDYHDF